MMPVAPQTDRSDDAPADGAPARFVVIRQSHGRDIEIELTAPNAEAAIAAATALFAHDRRSCATYAIRG